ncbi:hypothetical protein GGR52DRAFT_571726 [Hypoxylon sp. FL1284]|nr:hypothetical protein GGR52DRAFT_571726 [Hypoxylon sp. FL1284]
MTTRVTDQAFIDAARERGGPDLGVVTEQLFVALLPVIPLNYAFDWMPALRAFCEQSRTIEASDRSFIKPAVSVPDDIYESQDDFGWDSSGHQIDLRKIDRSKLNPRRPGEDGGYDFVWYVPEWSHPEFDPSIRTTYNGLPWFRWGKDALNTQRPALRPQDQLRQPSEWARRFGIHPAEPGGRSRMSPTLSQTRDPFQDYANQINLLNDDERRYAVETSRQVAAGAQQQGGDYIDPRVLEQMMGRARRLTGNELRALLEGELGPDRLGKANLDVLARALNSREPLVYEAHKTFFTNALADQDYQRLILRDMTTDEMVYENALTLSNEGAVCDLQNEIHPGAVRYEPRMLYNLNGKRADWSANTNDEVWEALQPALKLVSRVLQNDPEGMRELADLSNRRKLAPELDNRYQWGPGVPPNLAIYGEFKEGEAEKFEELEWLEQLGYDWVANASRVLLERLDLDIGSGWIIPCPSNDLKAVDGCRENDDYSYGTCWWFDQGIETRIIITLSSEAIWPLLIPDYSQSEKMMCSFAIASILLHELGHAVTHAQLLTTCFDHMQPPGQSAEVTTLVRSLGSKLWDNVNLHGEHIKKGHISPENGFDVEKSLFGMAAFNVMYTRFTKGNRHLLSMPNILGFVPYPLRAQPPLPGDNWGGFILGAPNPIEDYMTPVAIDHVAQFFSENWWTTVYQEYGSVAFKSSPTFPVRKTTMYPQWLSYQHMVQAFGPEEAQFLNLASKMFRINTNLVIAYYIRAMIEQAIRPMHAMARWDLEIEGWALEAIMPLRSEVDKINLLFRRATRFNRMFQEIQRGNIESIYARYQRAFQNVRASGADPGGNRPLGRDRWQFTVTSLWSDIFRVGGLLMRSAMEVQAVMARDVAYLQRLVFDYFSLHPIVRGTLFSVRRGSLEAEGTSMEKAYRRMVTYRDAARNICVQLFVASNIPQLSAVKHRWTVWVHLFRRFYMQYADLISMMGESAQFDPADPRWRKRFATVPSSFWKSSTDRLRILAHREYVRMDPRLRNLVDECDRIIRRYDPEQVAPLNANETDLDQAAQVLQQMQELGNKMPAEFTSQFDWTMPDLPPRPPQQQGAPAPSQQQGAQQGTPGPAQQQPPTPAASQGAPGPSQQGGSGPSQQQSAPGPAQQQGDTGPSQPQQPPTPAAPAAPAAQQGGPGPAQQQQGGPGPQQQQGTPRPAQQQQQQQPAVPAAPQAAPGSSQQGAAALSQQGLPPALQQPRTPRPPPQPVTNPKTPWGVVFGQTNQMVPAAGPPRQPSQGAVGTSTAPRPPNPFQNARGDSPFNALAAGGTRLDRFGPGGPLDAGGSRQQTAFPPGPPGPTAPFPNAYSLWSTTSEDVAAFEEDRLTRETAAHLVGMQGGGPAPYSTTQSWREGQPQVPASPEAPRAARLPDRLLENMARSPPPQPPQPQPVDPVDALLRVDGFDPADVPADFNFEAAFDAIFQDILELPEPETPAPDPSPYPDPPAPY